MLLNDHLVSSLPLYTVVVGINHAGVVRIHLLPPQPQQAILTGVCALFNLGLCLRA